MSVPKPVTEQIALISQLLHEKLGLRGPDLQRVLRKAKHRLPRRIYQQALRLARAEPLAGHPKLCLTLNPTDLGRSTQEVQAYLRAIDVADRRKGWWLGVLGSLAFNILLGAVLLLAFLFWRGLI